MSTEGGMWCVVRVAGGGSSTAQLQENGRRRRGGREWWWGGQGLGQGWRQASTQLQQTTASQCRLLTHCCLCRVPDCSEVVISEFIFPSSERSSELGTRKFIEIQANKQNGEI